MTTLNNVIDAIMTGTTTPQAATNFLKPLLLLNPLNHVTNTNPFSTIWITPESTFSSIKILVKLAIKKNEKPRRPDRAIIQSFLCFIEHLLSVTYNSTIYSLCQSVRMSFLHPLKYRPLRRYCQMLQWRDAFLTYDWRKAIPDPEGTMQNIKNLLALA